jgi:hypothetical protein
MSPKKRASEVEKVVREQEERLEQINPVIQDVKQEVEHGAAGRRVLKQGAANVEMSEGTETNEEPLFRKPRAKRKAEAAEEKSPKRREPRRRTNPYRRPRTRKARRRRRKQPRRKRGSKSAGRGGCWPRAACKITQSVAIALC